jgi:hypothetical protein
MGDVASGSVDTAPEVEPEAPHGQHEVEPAADTHVGESGVPAQENGDNKTNDSDPLQLDDVLVVNDTSIQPADDKKEEPSITDSGKPKPEMSVKTTGEKSAGPPTPLVKKVSLLR